MATAIANTARIIDLSTAVPDLTGKITGVGQHPIAGGGFANIWVGYWPGHGDRPAHKVAIKVLRFFGANESHRRRTDKSLRKEIRVWKRLKHPNILPLYGTISDPKFGPHIAMVCPWKENGTLSGFLEKNAAVLEPTRRYCILLGVLSGLAYLHRHSVVHGDLTGSNILLGTGGVSSVVLSDFGLSTILEDSGATSVSNGAIGSGSLGARGAIRWAAPETIIPSRSGGSGRQATKSSDICSCGRVMLQVFSGKIPYYHIRKDVTVLLHLGQGNNPPRPSDPQITDSVWELIRICSAREPQMRPTLFIVFDRIKKLLGRYLPPVQGWLQGQLQEQELKLEVEAHRLSVLLDDCSNTTEKPHVKLRRGDAVGALRGGP
ncbi:kinase-like domain-containing protein [Infundibulicybe gibba]|nr:kinase-like domain-containing protein [Infundibulicybe gibba]